MNWDKSNGNWQPFLSARYTIISLVTVSVWCEVNTTGRNERTHLSQKRKGQVGKNKVINYRSQKAKERKSGLSNMTFGTRYILIFLERWVGNKSLPYLVQVIKGILGHKRWPSMNFRKWNLNFLSPCLIGKKYCWEWDFWNVVYSVIKTF